MVSLKSKVGMSNQQTTGLTLHDPVKNSMSPGPSDWFKQALY